MELVDCLVLRLPHADNGVVRIDPLRFLTGWRKTKRRLNQALSVLSLSLGFYECFVLFSMTTFCLALVCVLYVFWLLVVVVSGVGTGGSGGSMNRGPELLGPRVVGPQKFFRQDS